MGSKTTSQVTNTPNPTASAAYNDVIGRAQQVASTPYQPYTGELVAGLNDGQQTAIGQLQGAYGTAQPFYQRGANQLAQAAGGLGNVQNYLQAGADATANVDPYQQGAAAQFGQSNALIGQSAAALGGIQPYLDAASGAYGQAGAYGGQAAQSYGQAAAYGQQSAGAYGQEQAALGQVGGYLGQANGYFGQAAGLATPQDFDGADGVSKYMNPYTSSVIDATMARAQQADAAQTAGIVGNAIGSGAYGGDRNGIAVAALAGQQAMANNSTIAGLNQANYGQATAQFNATQDQRARAAGIYSGLGQGELQAAGTQLQTAQGYGNVGAGFGNLGALSNATGAGFAGLGQLSNASGAGYAGLAGIQGQTAQQFGNLAATSTGIGTGFTGAGQLGLGAAGMYGTLGTLQGTTGQAYGTLGGLYGNLGTQAQSSAVSGASAGLQGATFEQQSQQAQDTAAYQQYQQALQYPFNSTGFLSNVVQGIGSASGNTQTTQGSGLSQIAGAATSGLGILGVTGAFGANGYLTGANGALSGLSSLSDERAKENVEPIGETYDGQTIHRYNYKGEDPRNVRTGLIAQEVEGHRPDAVSTPQGLGGLKAVDYAKATEGAAARGHFARGGGLGDVARMMGAPGAIRVPGGISARPHFDDGGGLGQVDGALQSSDFARGIARNPLAGGTQGSAPRVGAATASAAPPPSGGLGALSGNPGSGGLSNLSGSGATGSGGFGNVASGASSDPFGAGNDKLWLSLIAGGAGAMSGNSMSGLANIGQGIAAGLGEYQGLRNTDRQNALAQSEITTRAAQTALATREQDFKEKQYERLLQASKDAMQVQNMQTDPTRLQAAAPAAEAAAAPAVALPASSASGATASGAPTAGGWMPNTIPGSAAPVPAAPASTASNPQPGPAAVPLPAIDPGSDPTALSAQAAQYQRMGQSYMHNGLADEAQKFFTLADSTANRARQIVKDGTALSNGRVVALPGAVDVDTQKAAAVAGATASSKAAVDNQNALVAVQPTAGGPVQYVTRTQALQMASGTGGQPGQAGGLVKDQPPAFAQKQDAIAKSEIQMGEQFQARQTARERLDTMANIMTKYQTGDLAGAKADAVAFAKAIGLNISPSDTADPNFFQQFTKNATANVFDGVRSMGGQPRVAEIEGLTKANANPEMQPAANAAILAQAKGILNQEDQHYADYTAWKAKNPYATDTAAFELPWQKANPISRYVGEAAKDIPYKGQTVPADPAQRTVGQSYMSPTGKIAKWTPQGWAPVPAQGN